MSSLLRLTSTSGKLIKNQRSILNCTADLYTNHCCPFCKLVKTPTTIRNSDPIIYHNVLRRYNEGPTTRLSESVTKKLSKRKKYQKKYVELIQVSLDESNAATITERRAKINKTSATRVLKKLGVTTVSAASAKTKVETVSTNNSTTNVEDELNSCTFPYESNDFCHLSRSFDELMPVDQMTEEPLYEEFFDGNDLQASVVETAEEVENSKVFKKLKPEKIVKPKKAPLSEERLKEIERENRRQRKEKQLLPYLDVCINSNLVDAADESLLHNHYINKKFNLPSGDVKLYNTVLEGWAALGSWNRFNRIFNIMLRDNPQPNFASYVYQLECAYRGNRGNLLSNIVKNISDQGFDINNLLRDFTFVGNQKKVVIDAIRHVLPNFDPPYPDRPQKYLCNLLKNLLDVEPETRNYSPVGLTINSNKLLEHAKKQIEAEIHGYVTIRSIEKKSPIDAHTIAWRRKLEGCENMWHQVLTEKFNESLEQLKKQFLEKKTRQTFLYPYLKALKPKCYVDLMFQEIRYFAQLSEAYSPMTVTLASNLGNKVMRKYLLQKKEKHGILQKLQRLYDEYCKYFTNPELTSKYTPRKYWELLQKKYSNGPDVDHIDKTWQHYVLHDIGDFLHKLIIKHIKIDANLINSSGRPPQFVPCFYLAYRNHDLAKTRIEIKPNPKMVKLYKEANRDELIFDAPEMPMLSPPLPWTTIRNGGYFLSSAEIIRYPIMAHQQKEYLTQLSAQNMYPVFDSLNQLGECPWIVNKPMLDLIIEVFNNKGSKELDIPPPISECPLPPKIPVNSTLPQQAKLLREQSKLLQLKAEMYSLWCDMLYKLSIANQFRDEIFWFPHNMDFRGRVYPCPPHFNHLGGDVARSILLFAKGEPLGEDGLRWLKIHLINLTGTKKRCSIEDRLKYCKEVLPDIFDSADNPLAGKGWWKNSDEPWQTLACCMELTKALRSDNPHTYVCHFPVHQDGSCNGLQHYAALGRDIQGAFQVNLEPSQMPQDVYSGVAEMVENERLKDEIVGEKIAEILHGFVSRRVIKQTVMTTVYGVTRYGAKAQITRQLKDNSSFPQAYTFQASSYLVRKTFESLRKMFSATKEIQDWFTLCARLISTVCSRPVEWETPIGLPVVQPYYKTKHKKSDNRNAKSWKDAEPNSRKQQNAFPPNYIHSLDSTHMMLTSLFCHRDGITFVSVHDCFWTHPRTVARMNKICREQFIALHSEPLLENLSDFLVNKYCINSENSLSDLNIKKLNRILSDVPEKGTFNLERVLQSTYFFS